MFSITNLISPIPSARPRTPPPVPKEDEREEEAPLFGYSSSVSIGLGTLGTAGGTMAGLPALLSGLLETKFFSKYALDDVFDQLNRSFMTSLLFIMGTIVTITAYGGKPISCIGFTKTSDAFSEDYCWTQGMFTILEAYHYSTDNVPYPGIVPEDIPCLDCKEQQPLTRVYHLWYQWVPFYFWLSTIAFYMPYLLYKSFGFSDIKPLVAMLRFDLTVQDESKGTRKEKNEKDIAKASAWVFSRLHLYMNLSSASVSALHKHKLGILLLGVKVLYLGTSVLLMYLTTLMFPLSDYRTYGYQWFQNKKSEHQTDLGDLFFPKMVACEIKKWGPSGLEDENGMCVLAPNVLNQYIFLILWFFLVFTICCNVLSIICALINLLFTPGSYSKFCMRGYLKDKKKYRKVYNNVGSSGRLILDLLAKHTSTSSGRAMEEIMDNVCDKLLKSFNPYGGNDVSKSFVLTNEGSVRQRREDERISRQSESSSIACAPPCESPCSPTCGAIRRNRLPNEYCDPDPNLRREQEAFYMAKFGRQDSIQKNSQESIKKHRNDDFGQEPMKKGRQESTRKGQGSVKWEPDVIAQTRPRVQSMISEENEQARRPTVDRIRDWEKDRVHPSYEDTSM